MQATNGTGRRVVITGLGVVTALGSEVPTFWQNLLDGKSGIGKLDTFDASAYTTRIAGLVRDFDPAQYMERKEAKRMDRFSQFAVAAARMALNDSGLQITPEIADGVGVIVGSGIGGLETIESQHRVLLERGPDRVSPFLIPMLISDIAAGQVSILLGARGPNCAVVTACATGTQAIGDAYQMVRRGDAEAMFAGGTEAGVTPLGVAGFAAARALSTRNDDPEAASRPFDKDRDGFVMAEGAGVVLLETLEAAQARGARIYAEVVGYGLSGDAYHITSPAPEGEGAARAMRMALNRAGITPDEVNYINAHGTSTEPNDRLETAAVKAVFGEAAHSVAISSTKSMTGHLLGAAGAVEAAVCALSIRDQIVPPTINYTTPDPNCDLDYVPGAARRMPVKLAMSNSFGFGGHNATLVFRQLP